MDDTAKQKLVNKLRRDKEEAYIRIMETKEAKKNKTKVKANKNKNKAKVNKNQIEATVQMQNKSSSFEEYVIYGEENGTRNVTPDMPSIRNTDMKNNNSSNSIKIKFKESTSRSQDKTSESSKLQVGKERKPKALTSTERSRLFKAKLTDEKKKLIRAKDRERKRRAREEGSILRIGDMSKKEKKIQRKNWRVTKRKYRLKKKTLAAVVNDTPPCSDSDIDPLNSEDGIRGLELEHEKVPGKNSLPEMKISQNCQSPSIPSTSHVQTESNQT